MPTRSVLDLVDSAVPNKTSGGDSPSPDAALRAQAAFIRALVDEIDRHHPEDQHVPALHEQLGDELTLLAQLLRRGSPAPPEPAAAPPKPIDVMVVDDDDESRRAAVAALRVLGYPCREARNAEEALLDYERAPAAIVLADWCMPGMSGFDLCGALKRRDPQPYVILASAFQENARVLDGGRGGADDFLRKPIDLDELESRLLAASRLIRAVQMVASLNAGRRRVANG